MQDTAFQSNIKLQRELFESGKAVDAAVVRPEILASWERSRAYGVDKSKADKSVISEEELAGRIAARRTLYDIAKPFLEKLYEFTSGAGFISVLSDEEGYVLKILGDLDAWRKAVDNIFVEGCNRSERRLGTNAIGTCLAIARPIQVYGSEHFYAAHGDVVCSGAPIFSPSGKVAGALCLTGSVDRVHYHALGMVYAAAEAITRQLEMQTAYDDLLAVKNKMSVIIENTQTGLLLVDTNFRIAQASFFAAGMFMTSMEKIVGGRITEYIDPQYIDFTSIKDDVHEQLVEMEVGGQLKRFFASVFRVKGGIEPHGGFVVTMGKAETIHKMATKVVGTNAHFQFKDIIGESPAVQTCKNIAQIVAQNNSTVLLTGESGTGKELFAQSIHNASSRRNNAFIVINCGSLPRSLIESELFGYERGSFTGAKKEGQAGKFELADGGTIFLDEIGDMPFEVQVNFLRVLQNKEVVRVGGVKAVKVDVRVIAATNKNLLQSIENNTFRSDLYYRLNVFNIQIPPLRGRGEDDIRLLADYFLAKHGDYAKRVEGFTEAAYRAMQRYQWPGNIRELENAVERAALICQNRKIDMYDLPEAVQRCDGGSWNTSAWAEAQRPSGAEAEPPSLALAEKLVIENALAEAGGNVSEAAERLGISRRTMYRKIQKYQVK